jgi:hypothetical protein
MKLKIMNYIQTYTDIKGAFVDIERSSISVYNDIEVLNFDIDVSSISYRVNISKFQASISKVLRYRTGSISNVTTFDIDVSQSWGIQYRMSKPSTRISSSSCNIISNIEGHFPTFNTELEG